MVLWRAHRIKRRFLFRKRKSAQQKEQGERDKWKTPGPRAAVLQRRRHVGLEVTQHRAIGLGSLLL